MIKIVTAKEVLCLDRAQIQGLRHDLVAKRVHILSESTQNDLTYFWADDSDVGIKLLAYMDASSDSIEDLTTQLSSGSIPKDCGCGGSSSGSGASTPPTCYAKGFAVNKSLAVGANTITHNLNLANPKAFVINARDANGVLIAGDTTNITANSLDFVVSVAEVADITIFGLVNCSAPPSPTDTTPPSAPTALVATPISQNQINLNWVASTDNVGVTGYRIEYSTSPTFATVQTQTVGNVTTASIVGLNPATQYYFRIQGQDAMSNFSSYSSTANATTLSSADAIPPSAPTGLTATPFSETAVDLSWTASTDNVGVTGYRIQYSTDPAFGTVQTQAIGNVTTAQVTGLTAGTHYYFRVQAVDAAGNYSTASNTADAVTLDTTPPSVPLNLVATAISTTEIDLSWTASTDNVAVTGYQFDYSTDSTFATGVTTVDVGVVTTAQVTGLTPATQYYFRIRAKD